MQRPSLCCPSRLQSWLSGQTITFALVLLIAALLTGCSSKAQDVTPITEPLEEPVAVNPKPQSPGTLWNGDEGNWLADVKARRVGDIVTVIIKEKASASKVATTATDRSSTMAAGISSLFGLEKTVANNNSHITPSAFQLQAFS